MFTRDPHQAIVLIVHASKVTKINTVKYFDQLYMCFCCAIASKLAGIGISCKSLPSMSEHSAKLSFTKSFLWAISPIFTASLTRSIFSKIRFTPLILDYYYEHVCRAFSMHNFFQLLHSKYLIVGSNNV